MNILFEHLPTSVEIDDREYSINTDFRICLRIVQAYEDPELTRHEKEVVLLNLLYNEIPENLQEAFRLGMKFLNCGDENQDAYVRAEKVFSLEKDAKYIYTAMRQSYGIDLENIDYLHWWKWCSMFSDLREDCFFRRLIDLRYRRSRGKLTKEEREYCARIDDILKLPTNYTVEEYEAKNEFLRLLGKS